MKTAISKPSPATVRIVAAALEGDAAITPAHRRRIMEALTMALESPTNAPEGEGRLYTPSDVAALCGVSITAVFNWMKEGRLEARRINKRNYLIPASAVDAMLASRQPPPPISADALGDRLAHLATVAKPARKSRRG